MAEAIPNKIWFIQKKKKQSKQQILIRDFKWNNICV